MAFSKTLVAFDGEGVQDRYILLASSQGEIHSKRGLTPQACLEFLSAKDYHHTLNLWYSFDYDVNMILKGIGGLDFWQGRRKLQLGGYLLQYFPRKFLKIRVAGRTITHYDVFGFFQTSFRVALLNWLGVTDSVIEAGKQARGDFQHWTMKRIIEYNQRELVYLLQLGERLVDIFTTLDIPLKMQSWHGAGAAAQAALKMIRLTDELEGDPRLEDYAQEAYYGGRVETLQRGSFEHVYHADLRSAYPSAALTLPDLSHTTWRETDHFVSNRLGVYRISFEAKITDVLTPFPIRTASGLIVFPVSGSGTYWSDEIKAGLEAGCKIQVQSGLVADCFQPSALAQLVKDLYVLRQIYRSNQDGREKAIKLILNALYGKLAQKAGGRYHSLALAGLITAHTRAKIFRACHLFQDDVIGVLTDGVYTTVPLELDYGEELGQWERDQGRLDIIMNGVYAYTNQSGKREIKTRGFNLAEDDFSRLYHDICRTGSGELLTRRFVTNSLALIQTQKRKQPCVWEIDQRVINPSHDVKRLWPKPFDGSQQFSAPWAGGQTTVYYQPHFDNELEPEYIDLDMV